MKELDSYDALDNLLLEFPTLSTEVKDCAKEVANGTKSMKDFDMVCEKSASATSKFGATLKSIGVNIGIMLALNIVIKAVSKAWDEANVTVEEQKQKIDELKSSYEGLKSEYETLSEKQDITDAEKRRLDYLERMQIPLRELKDELKNNVESCKNTLSYDNKTVSKSIFGLFSKLINKFEKTKSYQTGLFIKSMNDWLQQVIMV